MSQEQAKSIIALSKSLRGYQLTDARIARHLYASSFAGRAGLVVSALRGYDNLDADAFDVMASNEGFTPIESRNTLVPWLEKQFLCHVVKDADGPKSFQSLILTYDQILDSVCALWTDLKPSDVDKACVFAMELCTELPMGRAELAQKLATAYTEQPSRLALELIQAYGLLGCVSRNLVEPIFYSPTVWRKEIASLASSLSLLNVTDKEVLLAMLNRVKAHQGLPWKLVSDLAKQENAVHVLDFAVRTGLLDKTTLSMPSGAQRSFLVTPHFYADVAADHGEDFCDRVKIFLDSIRNGQHFGSIDGKINNPDRLLEVLLDRGWVGPAPAIGRGYTLPEKSGIVRVERDSSLSYESYKLHVVQRDTIEVVRQIVGQRSTESISTHLEPTQLTGTAFVASETLRASLGTAPAQIVDCEADVIRTLRENGCRTRA